MLKKLLIQLIMNNLKKKMENAGIRCSALKLLSSYLSNRTPLVKKYNTYSNPLKVTHGVPHYYLYYLLITYLS